VEVTSTSQHGTEELCWKVMVKVQNSTHEPEWRIVQQPSKHQPATCGKSAACKFTQNASQQLFNSMTLRSKKCSISCSLHSCDLRCALWQLFLQCVTKILACKKSCCSNLQRYTFHLYLLKETQPNQQWPLKTDQLS